MNAMSVFLSARDRASQDFLFEVGLSLMFDDLRLSLSPLGFLDWS